MNKSQSEKVQEFKNAKIALMPKGLSDQTLVWRKPETKRGFTVTYPGGANKI